MDSRFFEDVHVGDVFALSGIRPLGRLVDNSDLGRRSSGFLYVWQGKCVFRDGIKPPIAVSDGELLFIPKGKKYKMEYSAPTTTFVLVNFNTYSRCGENVLLMDDITLLAKDSEAKSIAKIMSDFELCSASVNLPSILRRRELLYKLLGAVYGCSYQTETDKRRTSSIYDGVLMLEQTYLENIPITKFAEASHVSENTFRTLFQKQYNMSPVRYRNRLRVARARELLAEGSCTVAEAAWDSGFENVGYFCRLYKRITGEKPSDTKKKV